MSLAWYVVLAMVLFAIGAMIVLIRKSTIIQLMGVEIMLNSANLVFITFSRVNGTMSGQVMAFFVMVVAAAEVVIGLALIVAIFKSRATTDVDDVVTLKH